MTEVPLWVRDLIPGLYGFLLAVTLLSLWMGYHFSCKEALGFLPIEKAREAIRYAARHQAALLGIVLLLMTVFVWFRPVNLSEATVLQVGTVVFTVVNRFAAVNKKVHKRIVVPYLETQKREATQRREAAERRLEESLQHRDEAQRKLDALKEEEKRKRTDPSD